MILKVCVEIEMPTDLMEKLEDSCLTLGMLEDGLAEEIGNTIQDMLPVDTKVKECYPVGWDMNI